jgi:hypothetical protein
MLTTSRITLADELLSLVPRLALATLAQTLIAMRRRLAVVVDGQRPFHNGSRWGAVPLVDISPMNSVIYSGGDTISHWEQAWTSG